MFVTQALALPWLALQCRMIPNISNGMAAFNITDDHQIGLAPCWPDRHQADAELASTIDLAITRRASVISSQEQSALQSESPNLIIAYPLIKERSLIGVVGVRLIARQEQQAAVMQLLRWGTAWLQMLAEMNEESAEAVPSALFECLASTLGAPDAESAINSAATVLARELDCERVSIGLIKQGRLRVAALSHSAIFDPHSNLIRAIESAMQEGILADHTITCRPLEPDPKQSLEVHNQPASSEDGGYVCTLPLRNNTQVIGAVCFERGADSPFDDSTVAFCEQIGRLLGPVIGMKQRENRSFLTRVIEDAVTAPLKSLFGTRNLGWKLAAISLLMLLGIAGFSTGDYRVTAPASLEGVIQRVIVAPFDGYIAESHVRAGETVVSGQMVAQLDDRELNLKYQKWRSKREEFSKHYRQALAGLDHAETRIFRAQMNQADAQVALIKEQLDRTNLVAPFDGMIISGDLSHSLGTPVERGQILFEVAPLDAYRIALQIDERDIPDIEPGQTGTLVLSAMPDKGIEFSVDKVASITQPEEGQPAFLVEGMISDTTATHSLRPGMQGIGKIKIGSRNQLWIWTRRSVGWLQLHLWSWLP